MPGTMKANVNIMAKKKLTSGSKKAKVTKALKTAAKTNTKKVHVVKRGSKWATKSEGSQKASKLFNTQKDALKAAKSRVKKGSATSVVVHKKDGKIAKRK